MNVINLETWTFEAMMNKFESFARKVDALCREGGEKAMQEWLDNQDVCRLLGISPRTLQTMRDNRRQAESSRACSNCQGAKEEGGRLVALQRNYPAYAHRE